MCVSLSLFVKRAYVNERETECKYRRRNRTLLSLSLSFARASVLSSLSLSLLGAQKSAEVIFVFLFPFSTTFRVSEFLVLFLGFGCTFCFWISKEKDAGHSARVIIEIPSSAFVAISTSHRRRQTSEEEEESFLVYFVHPLSLLCLSLSLSFSLNQSFARCSTSAFF